MTTGLKESRIDATGAVGQTSETHEHRRPALRLREILVPIDFSEHAKAALSYAMLLASRFDARITLLHVIEPPYAESDLLFPAAVAPDQGTLVAEHALAGVCKQEHFKPSLIGGRLVAHGIAHQVITQTAGNRKSDLVVIGTHGRTGIARVVLGSTAEAVVRHAPCPVLVVPMPSSPGV